MNSIMRYTIGIVPLIGLAAAAFGTCQTGEIPWKLTVTSGRIDAPENWSGDVAPEEGQIGVVEIDNENNITFTFPADGEVRENSTTRVHTYNANTVTRTVVFDIRNSSWVKTGSTGYGTVPSKAKKAIGLRFDDYTGGNDTYVFGLDDYANLGSQSLFKISDALITYAGNKKKTSLTFSGGTYNFYDPENLDVGAATRPCLTTAQSTLALLAEKEFLFTNVAIRVAKWNSRVNAGKSFTRISDSTLDVIGDLYVTGSGSYGELSGASSNRVEFIGSTVDVGGDFKACMGDSSKNGSLQYADLFFSNSTVNIAGAFSPGASPYSNRVNVVLAGTTKLSASGGLQLALVKNNYSAGNDLSLEIRDSAAMEVGANNLWGRHAAARCEMKIRDRGRFSQLDGHESTSALFIGYQGSTTFTGGVTGTVEVCDNGQLGPFPGVSLGYAVSADYAKPTGFLKLSGNARCEATGATSLRIGRSAGCSGEVTFEDEACGDFAGTVLVGDSGTGRLILNGGSLKAQAVRGGGEGSSLLANGGAFVAKAPTRSEPTAIAGIATAELGTDGLVYDDDGQVTQIDQSFADAPAASGLFVKCGSGTLTALAASDHARTRVEEGALNLGPGVTRFGRAVEVAAGAMLGVSPDGAELAALSLADGTKVTMTADEPIVITGSGALTLDGEVEVVLANATTTGEMALFNVAGGVPASIVDKLRIRSAGLGYLHTLFVDGGLIKIRTEYHEPRDVVWSGTLSGDYGVPDNWVGGVLPRPWDTAVFGVNAERTEVTIDGEQTVNRIDLTSSRVFTFDGSGTLAGDLHLGGGTLNLASGVLADGGRLELGKGTLRVAAPDLELQRDLVVNDDQTAVLYAEEDVAFRGLVAVTNGEFVKLGPGTATFNLPAGTHQICQNKSEPGIGKLVSTPFGYQDNGEFDSVNGISGYCILDGGLVYRGTDPLSTIVQNPRSTAIGGRTPEQTASPWLTLDGVSYQASQLYVGIYQLTAEDYPAGLTMVNGAKLSAKLLSIGFMNGSKGRFFLAVTNSSIVVNGAAFFGYTDVNVSRADARTFEITLDGATTVFEHTGLEEYTLANRTDFNIGAVKMKVTNGATVRESGLTPIVFSERVARPGRIEFLSGSKCMAPGFRGENKWDWPSGFTNVFDDATLELTASATSLVAHPEFQVFEVGLNGMTVCVGEGIEHRLAIPVIGAGPFVKTGAGTLVLGKALVWAGDGITNASDIAVAQWTGKTKVEGGVLDFGGETASPVLVPGSGTIQNAVLAAVHVDVSGVSTDIGTRVPVVRLGEGVTTDVSRWRPRTKVKGRHVAFSLEDGVVYAEMEAARGIIMIVR